MVRLARSRQMLCAGEGEECRDWLLGSDEVVLRGDQRGYVRNLLHSAWGRERCLAEAAEAQHLQVFGGCVRSGCCGCGHPIPRTPPLAAVSASPSCFPLRLTAPAGGAMGGTTPADPGLLKVALAQARHASETRKWKRAVELYEVWLQAMYPTDNDKPTTKEEADAMFEYAVALYNSTTERSMDQPDKEALKTCVEYLLTAKGVYERTGTLDDATQFRVHDRLGQMANGLMMFKTSVQDFEVALRAAERVHMPPREVAVVRCNLATALRFMDKFEESRAELRKCVALAEEQAQAAAVEAERREWLEFKEQFEGKLREVDDEERELAAHPERWEVIPSTDGDESDVSSEDAGDGNPA